MNRSIHEEALRQLRVGHLEEAQRLAEAEIQRIGTQDANGELWKMRFVRAQAIASQGRLEEALGYLESQVPPNANEIESSATLRLYRGSFSCYLGRKEAAHRLLGEAQTMAQEAGLHELVGDIHLARAFTFFREHDYISSNSLYHAVLDLSKVASSSHLRGHGLWGIGKNLMIQGQYKEALPWLESSLAIFEEADFVLSVSTVWSELAVCYLGLGDDQKAMELLRKSEHVDHEAGWTHSYQVDLANIGNVFLHRRDYLTALSYYQRAVSLARQIKDPVSVKKWTYNINLAYARIRAQVDEEHPFPVS